MLLNALRVIHVAQCFEKVIHVAQYLVFCVVFFRSLFVRLSFFQAIVLSVLRITDCDYPFIFSYIFLVSCFTGDVLFFLIVIVLWFCLTCYLYG